MPYTVPALELRRMLAEARKAAAVSKTSFDLRYTRLVGTHTHGDEAWRAHSRGVAVRLSGDDGRGNGKCVSRDETAAGSAGGWWMEKVGLMGMGAGWRRCEATELVRLTEPSWLELKLSLYYPYAIVPEAAGELVCNY